MLATLPATLSRLATDTLARCNTHPDSCPCGLCKLQAAINEAAWRAEGVAKDTRCWAVRWWTWEKGWELVPERNYTNAEAELRADSLNQNAGEDDPQAEVFNQEEFDHDDVRTVQRGGLDLVSAGAAPAAVPAVLRHGAGAVRLPAGA